MNSKQIFESLTAMKTRFSAYEIRQVNGVEYLLPTEQSALQVYSATEHIWDMLAEGLNLGKAVFEGADGKSLAVQFANNFGLLGLHTPKKSPLAPQKAGLSPAYYPHHSKEYGEALAHFEDVFETLYLHYLSITGNLPNKLNKSQKQGIEGLTTQTRHSGLSYKLTPSGNLEWEIDELLNLMYLAYFTTISDSTKPLKTCKNCHTIYLNPHQKSEFCSVKCRNYYNVRVFRGKEKELD